MAADIATCASCGEQRRLCGSVWSNSIQQPRFCKECLLNYITTGETHTNDLWWLRQLAELQDTESLTALVAATQRGDNEEV